MLNYILWFLASSSMVDASPTCICPCNPTSTRSQESMRREISTSSTSEKSSPLFNILTTTATNATSASASLSSSVCYCPCSTTSSTSYLLCKYSYRNILAYSQNFLHKWNEKNALSVGILRVIWVKNCRILPVIRSKPNKVLHFIVSARTHPPHLTCCVSMQNRRVRVTSSRPVPPRIRTWARTFGTSSISESLTFFP